MTKTQDFPLWKDFHKPSIGSTIPNLSALSFQDGEKELSYSSKTEKPAKKGSCPLTSLLRSVTHLFETLAQAKPGGGHLLFICK